MAQLHHQPSVKFSFDQPVEIISIKFWNYNKKDDLQRGVSYLLLYADDKLITPDKGILLRMGSGLDQSDYS